MNYNVTIIILLHMIITSNTGCLVDPTSVSNTRSMSINKLEQYYTVGSGPVASRVQNHKRPKKLQIP